MIATLLIKDLKLYFRNQFLAVVTGLSLVFFVAVYFLIPADVNQALGIAIYVENRATSPIDDALADNATFAFFDSEPEMLAALNDGDDFLVGLAIPQAAATAMLRGEAVTLNAYYAPGIAAEARQIFDDVLQVIGNAAHPATAASFRRIQSTEVVLGNDIYDTPIAMRDRILPMLLLFILSVEVLGLATLLMREVEHGTARALTTTPLRLHHFFASKAVLGLVLAFGQMLVVVAIVGKLAIAPLLLLTTLLLGSFMIVGVGFLIAALARDNMSVMAWGALILLTFAIPGISIMLPGLATGWMELIPSFFLADALHRILNFEATWADVSRNLLLMTLIGLGMLAAGAAALRRRF